MNICIGYYIKFLIKVYVGGGEMRFKCGDSNFMKKKLLKRIYRSLGRRVQQYENFILRF